MPEELTAVSRKIAVWQTVKESYRAVFQPQVLRMPFIGLPVLLQVLAAWASFHMTGGQTDPKVVAQLMKTVSPGERVLSSIAILVACLSMYALYVSWQRYLVRGDRPSGAYFGPAFWRFLGFILLFTLMTFLCVLPIGLLVGFSVIAHHKHGENGPGAGVIALAVIFGIVVFIFIIRAVCALAPKFVAIAVDDRPLTWRQSFSLMRGNKLRLIGGSFLMVLPLYFVMSFFMLPSMMAGMKPGAPPQSMMHYVGINGLLLGVMSVAGELIFGAYNASVYRQLLPGRVFDSTPHE